MSHPCVRDDIEISSIVVKKRFVYIFICTSQGSPHDPKNTQRPPQIVCDSYNLLYTWLIATSVQIFFLLFLFLRIDKTTKIPTWKWLIRLFLLIGIHCALKQNVFKPPISMEKFLQEQNVFYKILGQQESKRTTAVAFFLCKIKKKITSVPKYCWD